MPLLIDTYNVLHVTGVLPADLAGIETRGLIGLISNSRFSGERTCLVCDGSPPSNAPPQPQETGRIHVIYSGRGNSADDVIERMIRRSSAPRRLTVVSSDRRILSAARKRRCRTMRAEEFLRRLAADHAAAASSRARGTASRDRPAPGPLSGEQIDRWIELFGLESEDLDVPSARPLEDIDDDDTPLDEIDMRRILGEE